MSQSITITLPDNVYRRVQNLAQEAQRDVTELVAERVVNSSRACGMAEISARCTGETISSSSPSRM